MLLACSALILPAGCGLFTSDDPAFDPDALEASVDAALDELQAGGRPLDDVPLQELFDTVQARVAGDFPGTLDPAGQPFEIHTGAGLPGQVAVLFASGSEYLAFVGSPVGVQWSLGPYAGFELRDFVLRGELRTFTEGPTTADPAAVFTPGDPPAVLPSQTERQFGVPDNTWVLEYGRGNVPSDLYGGLVQPTGLDAFLAAGAAGLTTSIANEFIRASILDALNLGTGGFGSGF